LRWSLGTLSKALTNELMHRDAEAHPQPEMFTAWAAGGPCPYSIPVERVHFFDQDATAWSDGEWGRMPDRELIRAICKEKGWTIFDPAATQIGGTNA
jgi:hypothetical protein